MKIKKLGLLIVALIALFAAFTLGQRSSGPAAPQEVANKAFDHVVKTNRLRCSYLVMPPQLIRDPNTGAMSGVGPDLITEAAHRLNLEVDWTEEVNFMMVGEGLNNNRYDAFCFTGYRWVPDSRVMAYTIPVFYSTTSAFVRADDTRFDNALEKINDKNVTMVTIDGEASVFLHQSDFPLSAIYSLPNSTEHSMTLEAVASHKADVALSNPLASMPYLVSHPDTIHRVPSAKPVRIYAHGFGFGLNEPKLLAMFNMALQEMLDDGTVDKILDKYEQIPDSFIRIPPHYTKG